MPHPLPTLLRLPTLILAFLLGVPAALAQPSDDPTTIFRHANFGPGWTVTLGQPPNVPPDFLDSGAVVREAEGIYKLGFYEPFDYGDVLVIVTVQTGYDGAVTAMRFDYGPGYDFAYERDDYAELLGAPVRREESDEVEVLTWEDGVTRFELVREVTPEGERWYSMMSEAGGEGL